MSGAAVEVAGLEIATDHGTPVLSGVDLRIPAGSTLALVGESGSGKTTTALALLGRVRPGLVHRAGTVRVGGAEPLRLRGTALRAFRRTVPAWLGQDPATTLTPHLTVAELVGETLPPGSDVAGEVRRLLDDVGLREVPGLLHRRPAELSGGQRRRAAIARALASGPRLLVLDEPTSGLDGAAVTEVLDTVAMLRDGHGLTVLLITHDMAVAGRVADEVAVLSAGRVMEVMTPGAAAGPSSTVAAALLDAALLPADHAAGRRGTPASSATVAGPQPIAGAAPALVLRDLTVAHPAGGAVVAGLDLTLPPGQGVALLGPSGVGKSTVVRALLGTRPATAGTIVVAGEPVSLGFTGRTAGQLHRVQTVSQDPAGSLNPALTVHTQLARAVRRVRRGLRRAELRQAVAALLDAVRLDPALASRRPRELSGGQAQRVAIARALAHDPAVLICDEATSSLDPTIQKAVLDLLNELRASRGLALLVVTHDPRVAAWTCATTLLLHPGGGHAVAGASSLEGPAA